MSNADAVILIKSTLNSHAVFDNKQIHVIHTAVVIKVKIDIIVIVQKIIQLRDVRMIDASSLGINAHFNMDRCIVMIGVSGFIG